jgi:hypothetical protein
MNEQPLFKLVCDICGSLTIKIENPGIAASATIVNCGRCDAPRGTIGALRDYSLRADSDLLKQR